MQITSGRGRRFLSPLLAETTRAHRKRHASGSHPARRQNRIAQGQGLDYLGLRHAGAGLAMDDRSRTHGSLPATATGTMRQRRRSRRRGRGFARLQWLVVVGAVDSGDAWSGIWGFTPGKRPPARVVGRTARRGWLSCRRRAQGKAWPRLAAALAAHAGCRAPRRGFAWDGTRGEGLEHPRRAS